MPKFDGGSCVRWRPILLIFNKIFFKKFFIPQNFVYLYIMIVKDKWNQTVNTEKIYAVQYRAIHSDGYRGRWENWKKYKTIDSAIDALRNIEKNMLEVECNVSDGNNKLIYTSVELFRIRKIRYEL